MLVILFSFSIFTSFKTPNLRHLSISGNDALKDDVKLSLPDPNTLIKVPYYSLESSCKGTWTIDYNNNQIYSQDSNAKLTYTYIGTKCYIVAHKGRDKCKINIQIDDTFDI